MNGPQCEQEMTTAQQDSGKNAKSLVFTEGSQIKTASEQTSLKLFAFCNPFSWQEKHSTKLSKSVPNTYIKVFKVNKT